MTSALVPDVLTDPCPSPDPDAVASIGDLAAFSIDDDQARAIQSGRRRSAIDILQVQNEADRPPKPAWKFWAKP